MTEIEVATSAQAAALADLARETFSQTFGHLYPSQDLAAFLSKYTPDFFSRILSDPKDRIWVATDGRALLGYAHAGACALPHPAVTSTCGELKRLYVRRGTQGSGLGGKLLHEALSWLNTPGRKLWIGVWSENYGAQRLYERH
ncbi:MAG: GNAT family N-acetyltransferase, partial [Rhodospirillaceae bacterium]|nr:GNAT family N-acetyltransferase [Rhodospirillaceae bacterium]